MNISWVAVGHKGELSCERNGINTLMTQTWVLSTAKMQSSYDLSMSSSTDESRNLEDYTEKFLNSMNIYKMPLNVQHHQSVGGY